MLKIFLERCKNIAKKNNIIWKSSYIKWETPKEIKADFSLTLPISIAYKEKKNKECIAKEIIEEFSDLNLKIDYNEKGYINFFIPNDYYQKFLLNNWKKKKFFFQKKKEKINIEYISANPTGNLHLAHFRHAIIGKILSNVYKFLGYDVTNEYYINDRGEQINKLIDNIHKIYLSKIKKNQIDEKKIIYKNDEIVEILIKKWGKKYDKDLKKKDFLLWKKNILKLMIKKIKIDLKKYGIKFDNWISEEKLYEKNDHINLLNYLEKKKLSYLKDNALFLRTSLATDKKDRVIIKENGDYTYFFSDILYHLDKFKRTDKIINLWGSDHHGYIERIKSVFKLLNFDNKRIEIILIQVVKILEKENILKKLSKRDGNVIELNDSLKYINLEELKFFLLENDSNQPLIISSNILKKNKKKTCLYYIQYAYARCCQIFLKAKEKKINKISKNINLLKNKKEREIFNLLIKFNLILEKMIEINKPQILLYYLKDLSKVWQNYYQNEFILNTKNKELTSQKLLMIKNIQILLKIGLKILDVSFPKTMKKKQI